MTAARTQKPEWSAMEFSSDSSCLANIISIRGQRLTFTDGLSRGIAWKGQEDSLTTLKEPRSKVVSMRALTEPVNI